MSLATAALLVAACGSGAPSAAPASGAVTATPTPVASPGGPATVVVDTDLSFDDILALAFLLRDPAVDVRAVTVTGTGLVHCLSGLKVMAQLLAVEPGTYGLLCLHGSTAATGADSATPAKEPIVVEAAP